MKIEVLYHSSIRFTTKDKVIYFDPYEIKDKAKDADIIFVTHSHTDHYSKKDIKKLINKNTVIVEPLSMKNRDFNNVLYVEPNEDYNIGGIDVRAVPSYNNSKAFHKRSDGFIGYILNLEGETYYVMGDCDENTDNLKVSVDNILIPIGGKYTFDYKEAANYINKVKPKRVIPHHLAFNAPNEAKVVNDFKKLVNKDIEVIY